MLLFKVFTLVIVAICRWRFPRNKSIATVIRSRYGNYVVKDIRRFEKLDFRYRKISLDIEFLKNCERHNVIPKFLQFRTATRHTLPLDYIKYQKLMLRDEIKIKEDLLVSAEKAFQKENDSLRGKISRFDFAHICTVFLCGNDNRINDVRDTHDKKLYNLTNGFSIPRDPAKVIPNLSTFPLSELDKKLLIKGLNFSMKSHKLNYADYCINFELLYRDVLKLNMNDKAKEDFIKTKLKEAALSSYYNFNNHSHNDDSLTTDEFNALETLANKRDLIIQKSDKGNSIVLSDKKVYLERMLDIVSDASKFMCLSPSIIKPGKELQYIDKHEEKLRIFLIKLLNSGKITKIEYDKLYPRGSKPGILYGLPNIHKKLINGIPVFRPILSAIGTCSYKLAKFLVPILKDISENEYTIKILLTLGEKCYNRTPRYLWDL